VKELAKVIRSHLAGIVRWGQPRLANGFVGPVTGSFQPAEHMAQGYRRI